MEQQITDNKLQNLVLENRNKLSVSGVTDILSFDDQIVILETRIRVINSKGGES